MSVLELFDFFIESFTPFICLLTFIMVPMSFSKFNMHPSSFYISATLILQHKGLSLSHLCPLPAELQFGDDYFNLLWYIELILYVTWLKMENVSLLYPYCIIYDALFLCVRSVSSS